MENELPTPEPARMVRIEWLRGGTRSQVFVEPEATKGAVIGRDLYDRDGTLIEDLGVYVGQALIARDSRFLNGYPAEKIITPQGTLIVRQIDADAVLAGTLTLEGGTQSLVLGPNIGSLSDLLLWYGPTASAGAMLKANGLIWFDTAGAAYFGGGVALEQAGSGRKLGDQRNNHPVTIGSIRSYWDGQTITYTVPSGGDPANVTIDVSAATLRIGLVSVSYSAGSRDVAQARGTTQVWHLYYRDANYSGGSLTLNAATDPNNLANANDIIWVGTVSIVVPPAGTGGAGGGVGGGGGGGGILEP